MIELLLVGIGTGNPEHITLSAIRALNRADVILIPRKGESKADLAELRRAICAEVVTNSATRLVEFDLPTRDPGTPDYLTRVDDWHDAIATVWQDTLAQALPHGGTAALLVWGDPSLYDSTLRIAGRLGDAVKVTVIPGITALAALTAAHAIPINTIGAPFTVTTGRQLRDHGWPEGVETLAVMLDAGGAFTAIDPTGVTIWWGAYVGMKEEIILSGPLAEVSAQILATREKARAAHGWIMDIYILRRD
ncbi:MAG: precorrin-6A synthase (deacetylating) [Proteobacteria bacterium]|nr:precorrin-6A synthase (deacetylating) [Pseudomonadota bacterium]